MAKLPKNRKPQTANKSIKILAQNSPLPNTFNPETDFLGSSAGAMDEARRNSAGGF
jgi:hypothetical protein